VFTLFLLAGASEQTMVLQNGLNGYEGCTDTYLYISFYFKSGEFTGTFAKDSNFQDTKYLDYLFNAG